MKIIVLVGGLSPERDVSISSGTLVANALIECGHDVMVLDSYLGTKNTMFPCEYQNRQSGAHFSYAVPEVEPDINDIRQSAGNGNKLVGDGVLNQCEQADAVFIALHGAIGENGQIQALFELHGIRYTGTGYIGSLLAMDKDLSKRLLRDNGIMTPKWKTVNIRKGFDKSDIKLPCVIKPCSCGSSIGVSIVEDFGHLNKALNEAEKYEDHLLIEEKIVGREFSVGILDNKALPPIEIIPLTGFYDYRNKYQAGLTTEICPAEISSDTEEMLKTTALKVHNTLKLGFYSRVDFILDNNSNVYCLEANTLPGMTPTSLLPQEAKAVGISYNELCEKIVLGTYNV